MDEQKKANNFFYYLKVFISSLSIFSALLYFLGRLRIEDYYQQFGINTSAMKFSTGDYMFSSFYIFAMVLILCVWVFIGWRIQNLPGVKILGFPLKANKELENAYTNYYISQKRKSYFSLLVGFCFSSWSAFGNVLAYVLIWVALGYVVYVPFQQMNILQNVTSINPALIMEFSIFLGNSIGILLFAYMLLLLGSINKKGRTISAVFLLLIFVVLLSVVPPLTTTVATFQSKSDLAHFTEVSLTSKDVLPSQIQVSPDQPNQSIFLKMIVVNNDIIYVFDGGKGQLYSFHSEDIQQIIYNR